MTSEAQGVFLPPSTTYRPDRLKTVVISEVATGVAISAGLYFLWYRKHPRSHFHFFNDNNEWLQMDKIGHATTAYNIGAIQYDLMRWCGVDNNQSIAIGGLTAIGYMSIVEIFDGFSSKWGFSTGDMLANIFGAALFSAQQKERVESAKDIFEMVVSYVTLCQILSGRIGIRVLFPYAERLQWPDVLALV